jgi:hypothetical protein
VNIQFDGGATDTLASAAAGFPWFVHLLGQAALLKADEERQELVTDLHVVSAVRSLMTNRLAQHFSDLYQTAVGDSSRQVTGLAREFAVRGGSPRPWPPIAAHGWRGGAGTGPNPAWLAVTRRPRRCREAGGRP